MVVILVLFVVYYGHLNLRVYWTQSICLCNVPKNEKQVEACHVLCAHKKNSPFRMSWHKEVSEGFDIGKVMDL